MVPTFPSLPGCSCGACWRTRALIVVCGTPSNEAAALEPTMGSVAFSSTRASQRPERSPATTIWPSGMTRVSSVMLALSQVSSFKMMNP